MATIKTTTPALPDYITYRFANRWCTSTALDIAQKEFIELADVPRERISFNTSAWFAAVARQLCGGVIDILVSPDPNSPDEIDILRKTRSTPATPVQSRQSSPSGRSTKSAKRSWLPRLA
ncbi:hypothetical protein B0H13DRAFT_1997141 [Mycena leptocephala]|nr:hypothetical protein B0H13DRAFT_1997141 [Mycena leptocephala]